MAAAKSPERLVSLDQFRGYTVAGMFLVNFLGGYEAVKLYTPVLKHHNSYCSYADTIMPQFLFAVGFAFRMTIGRRIERDGLSSVAGRVVRRMLGLALVAIAVYTEGRKFANWAAMDSGAVMTTLGECLKRDWFQTLMHIAVTSLWILPVIGSSAGVRVAYMLASAVAHVILSWKFNFVWCNTGPNGIDGGPLGFLTWTIPALCGSLVCDAMLTNPGRPPIGRLLAWGFGIMLIGYLLSCPTTLYSTNDAEIASHPERGAKLAPDPVIPSPDRWEGKTLSSFWAELPLLGPPPDPTTNEKPRPETLRQWNYWMMSQRAGTLSYLTFSAGFAIAIYVLFWFLADHLKIEVPVFRTLGVNALAGYVLYDPVATATKTFTPSDVPLWYAFSAFGVFFVWLWIILRHFERQGIYIRV